jgi:hypothetical protein
MHIVWLVLMILGLVLALIGAVCWCLLAALLIAGIAINLIRKRSN